MKSVCEITLNFRGHPHFSLSDVLRCGTQQTTRKHFQRRAVPFAYELHLNVAAALRQLTSSSQIQKLLIVQKHQKLMEIAKYEENGSNWGKYNFQIENYVKSV